MSKFNPDDVLNWRHVAHYNGGKKFFANEFACVENPRLTQYTKCDKKTRTCETTFRVDGVGYPSLHAANEAL